MREYTYSLVIGLVGLLLILGIFSGTLPAVFAYAISLIYAYSAGAYGKPKYLLPGLLLMGLGGLILYGPNLALFEIFLLALYGLVVGLSIFKRSTPELVFFPSLAFLFTIMLAMFYLQKNLLGVDGLEALLEVYLAQLQNQLGDPGLVMSLRTTLNNFSLSLIFLVAFIINLFFCWLVSKTLELKNIRTTGRFMFEYLRLRGLGIIQLVQLYMLAFIGSLATKMPLEVALMSLTTIVISAFYLQGLSLLVYSVKARSRGRIRLFVLVLVSLLMPFVQFLLAFMGLLDQRRDFRKLEKLR